MEQTHEEATAAGREVAILRRRLLDQEPISTVYDELGLQPTVSTAGRKEFFENRGRCFRAEAWPNHSAEEERTAYPEKSDWGTMPELPRSGRDSIHCAKFPLDQCATRGALLWVICRWKCASRFGGSDSRVHTWPLHIHEPPAEAFTGSTRVWRRPVRGHHNRLEHT
jgi:hypothetical protein